MKQPATPHRRAIAALLAAAAFPSAPALAQDTAPPAQAAPAPAPAPAAQPPVVRIAPPPPPVSSPQPMPTPPSVLIDTDTLDAEAEREAEEVQAAEPVARSPRNRVATRRRLEAPAPRAAAAPESTGPAVEASPPDAVAPLPDAFTPLPEPIAPPPTAEPQAPLPAEPSRMTPAAIWPWALGGLLVAALALFAWRRRRTRDVHYDEEFAAGPPAEADYPPQPSMIEPALDEPVAEAAPPVEAAPAPAWEDAREDAGRITTNLSRLGAGAAAGAAAAGVAADATAETPPADETPAEIAPTVEAVAVEESDPAAVAAMAAASDPDAGRPWLEFMMRPLRAGTNEDGATVEFELTIGNTGSVAAEGVRVSSWMFAADSGTEAERLLIEPPAGAHLSEVTIEPGGGARVEAVIALPRAGLGGTVLPVVVADARYPLPDGGEGHTAASFAIGVPSGDVLEPFSVDQPSGLHEHVEARLHGEPQRT